MKKDVNGFGDFCSWCEETYGKSEKYDESCLGEELFYDAFYYRNDCIVNIDEEALGLRKERDELESSLGEYKRIIYRINQMYNMYLYQCAKENIPAVDFYNLITAMRTNGWVYECQRLAEELYFSVYGYYQGQMDEYEYLCSMNGKENEDGKGQ